MFRLFFILFLLTSPVFAGGHVHLLFHIGQTEGGRLYTGGTILNDSQVVVKEGYVVVVPLDKACYPGKPVLQVFGALSPGEKTVFHVSLERGAEGYRLVSVGAVDDMGYSLPVTDDTAPVIARRMKSERLKCLSARHLIMNER